MTNRTERETVDAASSEAAKIQRFMSWMRQHGADVSALSVTGTGGAWQVHAARPLLEGQRIAHIPHTLTIPPKVARMSKIGKQIATLANDLSDYDYLTAYLLETRHEGGFWKPYVDILPADYSAHPLFFSEDLVKELKGSYIFDQVLHRRSRNAGRYEQLRPCLEQYGITREEYAWAACAVASRFHRRGRRPNIFLAMVPLSDLFDHDSVCNARWDQDPEGSVSIIAKSPIEAGGRLFENYGVGNAGLLEQYGFCVDGNPKCVAEIRLEWLSPEHPCIELWKRVGGDQAYARAFRIMRNCSDTAFHNLFSYLRLACFDEPSCIPRTIVGKDQSERVAPISRRNEIAALTLLSDVCDARLKEFHTSVEEDEALLKAGALQHNMRNVVIVRRDEKVVLNYLLDLTGIALPVLRGESGGFSEHAAGGRPYAEYFAELGRLFEGGRVTAKP